MKIFILFAIYFLFHSVECRRKQRPNIVLIMVDDLGWNDVSFHGSKQIPTPNIDALAKDGVILNNYYVSPMCTPSRGSLMTGKHPIRLGLQHFVIVADAPWGLSTEEKIFPQYLNELGYVSHGVGKWHLGFFKEKYLPTNRGFDSFFGFWTGIKDYYTHFANKENKTGLDLHNGLDNDWNYNGTYATDLFTMKAKDIIANHDRSKPLFLFLAQQAVHSGNFINPLQPPPEHYIRQFPHIENNDRKIYAGMVAALDACVGDIFLSLKQARMLHNTIIVFTTDNGGAIQKADGIPGSNYPLRGSKYNMWEGGVRGVAFAWSSHLRRRSKVSDHLMHVSDWLPTLYAAAGGDVRHLGKIDGRNMWPSLMKGVPSPRRDILHNIDPVWNVEGVRKDRFKLIKGSVYGGDFDGWYDREGNEVEEEVPNETPAMLRNYNRNYHRLLKKSKVANILFRKYRKHPNMTAHCSLECQAKLFVQCDPWSKEAASSCAPRNATCLFDIEKDPCEYHNIAQQHPDVVKELEELLDNYRAQAIPPLKKDPDPKVNPSLSGDAWLPWQ